MAEQYKKWGSITILVTLFSGIAVTGINNYLIWATKQLSAVAPVVKSVDKLTTIIIENQKMNQKMFTASQVQQEKDRDSNSAQHFELSGMIYNQNARFTGSEVKLNRVIDDCKENRHSIKECEKLHKGQ